MDKFFRQKTLAAVLFLLCLFALSFFNIRASWIPLKSSVGMLRDEGMSGFSTSDLESVINGGIYQKQLLTDAFGYLQRLMYKNEQSDFETVKDNGGMLHESSFTNSSDDTLTLAGNLVRLKSGIGNDIPVLYVMPPDKYIRGVTAFSEGIPYNDANETADSFLRMLLIYSIDSVDLRERIHESGIAPEELFYKTDNRWTTEASFWAFTELAEALKDRYGMKFDEDRFLTGANHYNRISYPASYLGELGKKAGKYYAGTDDFTVIYPKFDTDYTVRAGFSHLDEYSANGRFEDALLSAEPFQNPESADYVSSDKFSSYLISRLGAAHIRNNNNPNGPKIAFLSDSMMAPAISFLSVACSDVYMINPIYFSGDIYKLLDDADFDIVIVSFSPKNLSRAYFAF